MTLNTPLLRTTTTPIWLHPLAWSLDHLTLLRIFVQSVHEAANSDESEGGVASGEGRLSVGFISFQELQLVHQLHQASALDIYLASFIAKTVDTFQRELKSKPFRFESACEQSEPPTSQFRFGTTIARIKSELIVRTKRGFPFLLYNCARSTTGFRACYPCPDLRSLPRSVRRSLRSVDFTLEVVDPFHVAGLISLAQKQLRLLNHLDKPPPDVFKVYLITPHPSLAAVYMYVAKFPLSYMIALQDPRLEVEQHVTITRELIEVPAAPADDEGDTTDGRFLAVLAQILQEADSYERPFSRWFQSKKLAETTKHLRYQKFEKMAKRLNIQIVPERLFGRRKEWRKIKGGIKRLRTNILFPHHCRRSSDQSILRKLDYVSSLRPLIRMCLVPRILETGDKS